MKVLKLLSMCALAFAFMTTINALRFQYGFNDAFWRTLMSPFEGTVWAPGFKESEFLKVREGMLAMKVTQLIGEPLRKDCGTKRCFWIYTWQDTPTADFDQRWVVFDLAERVVEVRKSFFID